MALIKYGKEQTDRDVWDAVNGQAWQFFKTRSRRNGKKEMGGGGQGRVVVGRNLPKKKAHVRGKEIA